MNTRAHTHSVYPINCFPPSLMIFEIIKQNCADVPELLRYAYVPELYIQQINMAFRKHEDCRGLTVWPLSVYN
jgi:hypothetical protein